MADVYTDRGCRVCRVHPDDAAVSMDELESCVGHGPDRMEFDCRDVRSVSPEVLFLLSRMCERCTDARLPVRLSHMTWSLLNLMEILFPPSGSMRPGDLGVLSPASIAMHSELVPVVEADLEETGERLLNLLEDVRLSDLTRYLLRTLFEEATCNIRLHSGLGSRDRLFCHLRVETNRTMILLAYEGQAFNPTEWSEDTHGATRATGDVRPPLGIKLMSRISHMMRYMRVDDSLNVFVLTRRKEW